MFNSMSKLFTRKPLPPPLGLAFGVLSSSTAAILIRFAQKDAPSLVIAAYRLALASLILFPIVVLRQREDLRQYNRNRFILAALAGVFLAIHFATWITSLEYTSVASSVVLVSTSPLFVSLFSPLFLNEPIHRKLRNGLLLSLLGTVIVGLSDACYFENGLHCPSIGSFFNAQAIKGDFLALLGAISGAAYLLIGRRLRGKIALLSYVSVAYGFAAIVLVGIVLIMGLETMGYPTETYLWFLLLALFPQIIGHSTINWALRYLPAAYVSVTLLGEPVASTIWAYLFLGETPSGLMFFGAIFVLLGIGIASQPRSSRNVKPRSDST
jgi:drug/metabolite transporter (DMT)-like permease